MDVSIIEQLNTRSVGGLQEEPCKDGLKVVVPDLPLTSCVTLNSSFPPSVETHNVRAVTFQFCLETYRGLWSRRQPPSSEELL